MDLSPKLWLCKIDLPLLNYLKNPENNITIVTFILPNMKYVADSDSGRDSDKSNEWAPSYLSDDDDDDF